MADPAIREAKETAQPSAIGYVRAWGESPLPPTVLATLIAAQHMRPPQFLPLLFPPVFLFSTYLNLNGYETDAAGTSMAWSGLYLVLASRRKHRFLQKWGARGIIRGTTMGLCTMQILAGGLVYALGKRDDEPSAE